MRAKIGRGRGTIMGGITGVACTRCKNTVATVRCIWCKIDVFLCQDCFFAHSRIMHPDTPDGKKLDTTLQQDGFTWRVTVSKDAAKSMLKGKSKKQLEREAVVKYIKENLKK